MAETPVTLVKIHRRRFGSKTKTSQGIKGLVQVTYSTRQFPPKVMQFYEERYSPEIERAHIIEDLKQRLKVEELSVEFIELT